MATARETARRKRQAAEAAPQEQVDAAAKAARTPRRLIVQVTYETGKAERVKIKPYHLGMAEQEFEHSQMLQVLYGTYLCLGEPGGDFDAWALTVDHAVSEDEAIPPPTSNGRST